MTRIDASNKTERSGSLKLIDVGYGNMINSDRIICIASFDSSPIKRLSQDAKEDGMAVDVTCGHKCLSVIITDSNHVILSSVGPEELKAKSDEKVDGD